MLRIAACRIQMGRRSLPMGGCWSTIAGSWYPDTFRAFSSQPQASPPPPTTTTTETKSFLARLFDRWSIRGQQDRIRIGEEMFQAATRQANDPRWYGPGRIPRDFRSRHAMLSMHIWFLHKRLVMANGANGIDPDWAMMIQDELFRILWNDTLCRIRQQGVYEMSVEKNLQKVQKYTFLHLFHYDHIYQDYTQKLLKDSHPQEDKSDMQLPPPPPKAATTTPDQEFQPWDPLSVIDPNADLTRVNNRITELKKLIWMHVMVRDPEAKQCDDHLERMAWYVETQFRNIVVDWPADYVQEARVAWVSLPSFDSLKDNQGKILPPRPVALQDVLPDPWLTNITLRGEVYYWNPHTRQSQWEHPATGQTLEKK